MKIENVCISERKLCERDVVRERETERDRERKRERERLEVSAICV